MADVEAGHRGIVAVEREVGAVLRRGVHLFHRVEHGSGEDPIGERGVRCDQEVARHHRQREEDGRDQEEPPALAEAARESGAHELHDRAAPRRLPSVEEPVPAHDELVQVVLHRVAPVARAHLRQVVAHRPKQLGELGDLVGAERQPSRRLRLGEQGLEPGPRPPPLFEEPRLVHATLFSGSARDARRIPKRNSPGRSRARSGPRDRRDASTAARPAPSRSRRPAPGSAPGGGGRASRRSRGFSPTGGSDGRRTSSGRGRSPRVPSAARRRPSSPRG